MNEQVQAPLGSHRAIFSTIPEAVEDIRAGKIVLVVDDADRENEGDFIMAAEAATQEAVNFMVTHGRGIVCLPCAAWRLDELGIPQMVTEAAGGHEAAFSVSIDFRHGTTTGTSATWPGAGCSRSMISSLRRSSFRCAGRAIWATR